MTAAELDALAEELGLDAIGVAPAEPYAETERHIRERRARGLFADMRFTMARPEESCHPETLLPGARTVVSAALCYWLPEPERPPGHGRLPRYTWFDAYAQLREKLDALGRRLGGTYRVLVDANQHVDREAAARSGVGFYGKNTLLITRRHGSWVVLGTLVTDVELESTPPLGLDCGECRLCIDACPTGRARRAGNARLDALPLLLDAGVRAVRRWSTAPRLGAQVYGCDICQDVCPWNRGVEKRRAGEPLPDGCDAARLARSTGCAATRTSCGAASTRLYVPRNDGRRLRLNALVAAGNVGGDGERDAVTAYLDDPDETMREVAAWALERLEERDA